MTENVTSQFRKALDLYLQLGFRDDALNGQKREVYIPGYGFLRLCAEMYDELPHVSMRTLRHRLIATQSEDDAATLSSLPLNDFHEMVSEVFSELQQKISGYSKPHASIFVGSNQASWSVDLHSRSSGGPEPPAASSPVVGQTSERLTEERAAIGSQSAFLAGYPLGLGTEPISSNSHETFAIAQSNRSAACIPESSRRDVQRHRLRDRRFYFPGIEVPPLPMAEGESSESSESDLDPFGGCFGEDLSGEDLSGEDFPRNLIVKSRQGAELTSRASGSSIYTKTYTRASTDTFLSAYSHRTSTDSYYTSVSNRSSADTRYHSRSSQIVNKSYSQYKLEVQSSQYPSQSRNRESVEKSEWYQFLQTRNLIPPPFEEQDWSGRGQHAEFGKEEEREIPLVVEKVLGYSATALVQSVICRRIRLACKTIKCGQKLKRENAIKEVEHLQRLQHSHIVRVVGTYAIGKDLSILLYLVAEYNLETLMDSIYERVSLTPISECVGPTTTGGSANGEFLLSTECVTKKLYLKDFFGCLSNALQYIHSHVTKHMDIKPKNILVRNMGMNRLGYSMKCGIYIADFGISRSYKTVFESETESPTSFTKTYTAPEAINQSRRGLSADIFSLGCVFAEMLAAIAQTEPIEHSENQPLRLHREKNKDYDPSYQANAKEVQDWLLGIRFPFSYDYLGLIRHYTRQMLESNHASRPIAAHCPLGNLLTNGPYKTHSCCTETPESFEAVNFPEPVL
ncbi:kinase-like protein [Glonium stellatum]|uniref:Kinase-like protein n=1 Tax=Glonium stellatum TaxID=574774 RepID=A0A8E2FAM9_9PEZI|nr:kinase-like protein [Glonium stellatum]